MSAQPRNGHDNGHVNPLANQVDAASEVGRQLCEPAARAMARSSGELMCLASRRAQAYLELPARFGACRTPQEVLAEQARFAQTAWMHYSECCARVASAYQAVAPQSAGVVQFWQTAMRQPFGVAGQSDSDRHDPMESDGEEGASGHRSGPPRRVA